MARASAAGFGVKKEPSSAGTNPSPSSGPPGEPRSTGSGSTQQHGPKFKRLKPGSFVVQMVEEFLEDNFAADMLVAEDGDSISDSGATAPVVGDKRWARFLAEKAARENHNPIAYH